MHLRKSFVRVALNGNTPTAPAEGDGFSTAVTSPFQSTRFETVEQGGMMRKVDSAMYAVQEMGLGAPELRLLIQKMTQQLAAMSQPAN